VSVSRRRLLLVAPAAALAFAAACKKGAPASCGDTSSLGPDEVATRNSLGYADKSLDATQECIKCRQYVPAASDGACGGCKIMKGPIHPLGTCRAFAGT
jgi:hypothetical protein